jgi:drug/metabolite transporter (DMT)-like permease
MTLQKWGPWLVFIAAMLWATDAPFRVHLTKELSSSFIVLAEHFIDVLFILPVLWWKRREIKTLGGKERLAVLLIAVGSSALASVAFTKAFSYVNPSVAIVLQKLQPLLAIGLAASLLKEELRARFWLWAGVAIAGAYVVSFPNLSPKLFEGETFNPNFMGVALALTAAALWGAGTVLGKYVLSSASFQTMTALRFLLAFVFLLGMNTYQKSFPAFGAVSAKTWLYIVIIAVTSGVVSLFIYYKGLTHTKASIATLAELGFPLAAVLVNYFALRIELQPSQMFGMTLLLFAIFNLTKVNRQATESFAMASGNQS